ncbi:MAG: hypothetical protein LBL13_11440 [Bacteroidales bacterium]|jgi:hypothetical protein|nr:hypothetical protein [Bacteroidales bacterium]
MRKFNTLNAGRLFTLVFFSSHLESYIFSMILLIPPRLGLNKERYPPYTARCAVLLIPALRADSVFHFFIPFPSWLACLLLAACCLLSATYLPFVLI